MTTTIDNPEGSEPALEWCASCDRPVGLCECASVTLAADSPDRTAPAEATGHRADTARPNERTATGQREANAVDTDRTREAEPTGQRPDIRDRMETAPSERPRRRRAVGWVAEWGSLIPIWLLAGALGAAGFAVSFFTVEKTMRPYFDELAWLVPAGTDLGIIVFTLLDIVLARRGQRIPWMRYIPWVLTAATIYLNVSAYTALEAQVAHAVLPSLWVVFSEAIARIMREKAEDETPTTKKVPLIRWACAPVATLILWRAMRLWDIDTYTEALEREEERQLARAVMKDCFGSVRSAPRTLKVRYRQRKITVDEVYRSAVEAPRRGTAAKASTARPVAPTRSTGQDRAAVQSRPVSRTKAARSKPSKPRNGQGDGGVSTRAGGQSSKTDALSKALADFRAEGVADPTVRQLAERAGCSTGLAGAFKKRLNESTGAAARQGE